MQKNRFLTGVATIIATPVLFRAWLLSRQVSTQHGQAQHSN
jgi:hypothetical protein